MPCSCEGFPPSPNDLVTRSHKAVAKIKQLEAELKLCKERENILIEEVTTLKKAFKMMGNGG